MKFEDKVEQLRIKKHGGRETEDFLDDIKKLAEGEAYEYLLGEVDFCNTKIDLSLRPMIPRPETEYWVQQVLKSKVEVHQVDTNTIRILDLFSGSGCVGLALLKNIPECTVDFIEYDPRLKEQIEISVAKNKIDVSRTNAMTGDTWSGATGLYDIITAVPPYVPLEMRDEVMKELKAEEPLSFFDKEDGYYYHKQVLSKAKEFLVDGGTLYLEFDITQREIIEQLAIQNNWSNYSFLKDLYGHECTIKLSK